MKIIILAAAALVATTLGAAANHDVDGSHDDGGVFGTPGQEAKLAATASVSEDLKNEQGLSMSGSTSISAEEASPGRVGDDDLGARMPDGTTF